MYLYSAISTVYWQNLTCLEHCLDQWSPAEERQTADHRFFFFLFFFQNSFYCKKKKKKQTE